MHRLPSSWRPQLGEGGFIGLCVSECIYYALGPTIQCGPAPGADVLHAFALLSLPTYSYPHASSFVHVPFGLFCNYFAAAFGVLPYVDPRAFTCR
ncbi:hypothetical protein VTO73DRAFT_14685 [Trametes versicolor]